jgi:hypothetical protein
MKALWRSGSLDDDVQKGAIAERLAQLSALTMAPT